MVLATSLLGISTGSRYLTWPSLDCDPSEQTLRTAAQAGVTWLPPDTQLVLRFDFPDETPAGDGTNINAFEGSVEFPSLGRYYAVWPSLEASSKCELLLEVRDFPLSDPPEPDDKPVIQCWALASNPWVCIIDPSTGEIDPKPPFPTCTPGCP